MGGGRKQVPSSLPGTPSAFPNSKQPKPIWRRVLQGVLVLLGFLCTSRWGVQGTLHSSPPPSSPQHDYRTWLGAITDLTTYSSLLFSKYNLTKVPVEFTIRTLRDSFLFALSPEMAQAQLRKYLQSLLFLYCAYS